VGASASSFSLSKHTGKGDITPTFSGLHVYLQFMWEVGLPPSPVEFSSLHHSHKLSHSWLLGACPRSCQSLSIPPGLFIYSPGKDSLPSIFGAQCAPPSFLRVFIVLLLISQFLFFSLGGGRSVQGLCCSGPGFFVGGPWFREAHLVRVFPSCLAWVTGGPGALRVSPCNPSISFFRGL
jgi:hypothetical protein